LTSVLLLPGVPYEIVTYTSNTSGGSTDADVYIVVYGKEMVTQQKSLCVSKQERKKSFKKGAVDKFVLEVSGEFFSIPDVVDQEHMVMCSHSD
jgi:hypothetical protein